MAFKCIYFKQRLGNLLQCSSSQVMLKVLFFLRYQGRGCISAVRPSVKWGIAVCHAECCTMYLTPWFKQYLRSTNLCLQWSGISCHMEWYQTSYLCQRLSCLSRTSNVYAGREVSSISDTLLLAVIHITDVHVLLFDSAVFVFLFFCAFFILYHVFYFSTAYCSAELCMCFDWFLYCFHIFWWKRWGPIQIFCFLFFVMCTNTLQTYFILSLSFFNCFPFVFCSLSCGINHIRDVIALVLWTVDKLRTFMILPCVFSLWILTNMYLYKYCRCVIFLGKLQFKYSWRSSTVFYWHFYNKLVLSFRGVNTLTCLPKGSTKASK